MNDHEDTGGRISKDTIDKHCFQLHVQVNTYYAPTSDNDFRVPECSEEQQSKRNDEDTSSLPQLQCYQKKGTSASENEHLMRRSSGTTKSMHSERSQLSYVENPLILHAKKVRITFRNIAPINDNSHAEDDKEKDRISYKNDPKDQMNESLLIVLVPPSISQLAVTMIQQGSAKKQQDDRWYNYRKKKVGEQSSNYSSKGEKLSSSASVGRLIHPCLSDLSVHQVIVLDDQQQPRLCKTEKQRHCDQTSVNKRRPTNSPSDFIIFKVDKTIDAKEIIGKIHGEAMSCASHAVIKPFSVSYITYHCAQQQHPTSLAHGGCISNTDRINLAASRTSSSAEPSSIVTNGVNMEIPTCSVCLHRIDPVRLGLPSTRRHQLCSHHGDNSNNDNLELTSSILCKNRTFLTMWPAPSNCIACALIQNNATVTFDHRQPEGLSSYSSDADAVLWQQQPRPLSGSSLYAVDGSATDRNKASSSPSNAPFDYISAASASYNHQQIQAFTSSNVTTKSCLDCGMKETLWLCLTCGYIGCGRYSHGHAINHFLMNSHPFSLELVTGRIWAYNEAEYIQRNDFLKCPFILHQMTDSSFRSPLPVDATALASINPARTADRKSSDGVVIGETLVCESKSFLGDESCQNEIHVHVEEDRQKNEVRNPPMHSSSNNTEFHSSQCPDSPKKAIMINEIYDALLQSALEDQSQHFEGELIRLRAELAASEVKQLTPEDQYEIDQIANAISALRIEADRLSKENLEMVGQEAGYRASYERLLREQQVQQSIYEKIKQETSRERAEGESQVEELEQQLRDLNAYLKIQQELSQNQEVRNSRIFGTSYNTQKSDLKSTVSGKKSRRLFRRGG